MDAINHQHTLPKTNISIRSHAGKLHIAIITPRLHIRSYTPDDFENCVRLYGDEKLTKFFDHGNPRSRQEVEQLVTGVPQPHFVDGHPFGVFSMFDPQSNAFLGQVDLLPAEMPYTLELGCILLREYHNQGFPVEACKALLCDYVPYINTRGSPYTSFPIQQVIATAHPKNYASQKLIRNLGMTFYEKKERFNNMRFWYSITIQQTGELHES